MAELSVELLCLRHVLGRHRLPEDVRWAAEVAAWQLAGSSPAGSVVDRTLAELATLEEAARGTRPWRAARRTARRLLDAFGCAWSQTQRRFGPDVEVETGKDERCN